MGSVSARSEVRGRNAAAWFDGDELTVQVGAQILVVRGTPVRARSVPVVNPLSLERAVGDAREQVHVAHDRPVVVIRWDVPDGIAWDVSFDIPAHATAGQTDGLLRVDGPGSAVLIGADPRVEWRDADGQVRARCAGSTRLVIGTTTGVSDGRVLACLRDFGLVERANAALARRLEGDGLVFSCGHPELAETIAAARLRLVVSDPVGDLDDAWRLLAAAAAGDADTARAALRRFADADHWSNATNTASALGALAIVRFVAWTGDSAAASTVWPHACAVLDRFARSDFDAHGFRELIDASAPSPVDRAAIAVAALRDGVIAAEALGDAARARLFDSRARRGRLALDREYARTLGADRAAATDGPAAGARPDRYEYIADGLGLSEPARVLTRLARTRAKSPHDPALRAWAEWVAGQDAEAAAALSAAASAGSLNIGAAARTILAIVHGALGAEPDAPRRRLRLRPVLSLGMAPLSVSGITMGDSRFGFDARLDEDQWTLRVEQTDGPVPARLVLEPVLVARGIRGIRVDGQPARLDVLPQGEAWIASLQLVLDHPRTVTIEVLAG